MADTVEEGHCFWFSLVACTAFPGYMNNNMNHNVFNIHMLYVAYFFLCPYLGFTHIHRADIGGEGVLDGRAWCFPFNIE